MFNDKVTGLLLSGLGVLTVVGAARLPSPPVGAGPALFPTVVGALLAIVGAAIAVTSWRKAPVRADPDDEAWYRRAGTAVPVVSVLLAVPAFVLLAPRLGFLLTMPLVQSALMIAFGVRWIRAIAISVATTVVLYVVFVRLFRVPLPWGFIEEAILWISR